MSPLDELPPDHRAALSVLLLQHKSYAEVGRMLQIDERAVHDRAHAALAVLAPSKARMLTAEQREQIADYLLGQAAAPERLRARTLLESSEPARDWANALATELRQLAPDGLPEIPAPTSPASEDPAPPAAAGAGAPLAPAAPPTQAREPPPPTRPQASRIGGAILLGLMLAGIVVAIVFLTKGGSGSHPKSARTRTSGPRVTARLTLRSPTPSSHAVGAVDVLAEGGRRAFYIVAEGLPETHGFYYALWLYNSPSSAQPLSRAPAVGSSHRLEGGSFLPTNAGSFREMLLTRETQSRPPHPGPVELRGRFTLG